MRNVDVVVLRYLEPSTKIGFLLLLNRCWNRSLHRCFGSRRFCGWRFLNRCFRSRCLLHRRLLRSRCYLWRHLDNYKLNVEVQTSSMTTSERAPTGYPTSVQVTVEIKMDAPLAHRNPCHDVACGAVPPCQASKISSDPVTPSLGHCCPSVQLTKDYIRSAVDTNSSTASSTPSFIKHLLHHR
jgi:hypothetical protein